jgi:hypothetical protein
MNDYKARHNAALRHPDYKERPFLQMLTGWESYANQHRAQYDSPVGHDYVLGEEWLAIGKSLQGLLNGDLGNRLDMGTLDSRIRDVATRQGVDLDLCSIGQDIPGEKE